MSATPGVIEGPPAPVVPESPPPPAAGEAKVTGQAAEQADALATAAASAGAPDKQLGVLAAGAKRVMGFFKGNALPSEGVNDPIAAAKPMPTEVPTENPKVDGLPDPFDGKSVADEGVPKDTTVPPAEVAPVEPAVGEKALTEINGLLGDGIVTKDSKADDLMGQLVAKGWKNDADTLNYVQGAIDTALANAPAEPTDSGQPESSEAQTTEQGSENQTAQSGEAQPKTPEQQRIETLEEQVRALTENNNKLMESQRELAEIQLESDDKKRRENLIKFIAKLTAMIAASAVLQVTEEVGDTVTEQGQQRR